MCTISNKVKLCTGNTKDVTKLKNYWILNRFVKGKSDIVLGEVIMPYFNPSVDVGLNEDTLLKLLNEGNVFDFDIELKDKDLLHLAFKFNGDEQHNNYGFEFKKGKWKNVGHDFLTWMWHHEEYKYGKIKTEYKNK
ncbi:hypothetical protein [Pedobacter jejuensis]|uniref:Uncharacterized protein n=1 Tax=Pedobacter jejuensis TaxID=1268550 RepID=A0A3N0BX12_9SPHI|nr:hypothetical protein [Pedobacter jejuensis]RNL54168.1 hypothetical protein D7004_08735 [Pedobacter jejuensis]